VSLDIFAKRERRGTATATVTVRVDLEIAASGAWSRDTTLAQVDTQAIDSANAKFGEIERACRKAGIALRVVSRPVLVAMTVASDGVDATPEHLRIAAEKQS